MALRLAPSGVMARPLVNAPLEILQQIVLSVSFSPGPPIEFLNVLLTCKALKDTLLQSTPQFFTLLFGSKFDFDALTRRLGHDRQVIAANSHHELCRRLTILKAIRHKKDLAGEALDEALWMVYLMSLENAGKNAAQLLWAEVPDFLKGRLKEMRNASNTINGWPIQSKTSSLVVAAMWYLTSKSSVQKEQPHERAEILDILRPIVLAAFRYSSFYAPETIRDTIPLFQVTAENTQRNPRTPAFPFVCRVVLFGSVECTCLPPPTAIYATLNYFVRSEQPLQIPPHLPETRADADAANILGPTREDVISFNLNCTTICHLTDSVFTYSPTFRHDGDWMSARNQKASYKLGLISGCWRGSQLIPDVDQYALWLSSLQMPSPFPDTGRQPLSFTLQEHFNVGTVPIPSPAGDDDDSAWLPIGLEWEPVDDGIRVFDPDKGTVTTYQTFHKELDGPLLGTVTDLIITGKPDREFAAAWGDITLVGRVRLSDGLVVLYGHSAFGQYLYRGYVISGSNFVGRARGASHVQPAPLEMPFSLSKA
ncbi:hypothetical protein HGRIS_006867 [Hohenbuehelia grisea]|uniref:F-box domain-containing protein n=1 Tax=Hohenbuehelia grisea TaxID=104357 RepID=A0ABR3JBF2_9AGAR